MKAAAHIFEESLWGLHQPWAGISFWTYHLGIGIGPFVGPGIRVKGWLLAGMSPLHTWYWDWYNPCMKSVLPLVPPPGKYWCEAGITSCPYKVLHWYYLVLTQQVPLQQGWYCLRSYQFVCFFDTKTRVYIPRFQPDDTHPTLVSTFNYNSMRLHCWLSIMPWNNPLSSSIEFSFINFIDFKYYIKHDTTMCTYQWVAFM